MNMEEHKENNRFEYSYRAKEQQEIQHIRDKYLPKQPNKLEQLRRLDRSVTSKGTAVALAVGILATLILGVGMCCTMVWGAQWFIPGVIIGLLGMAGVAAAYPLYRRITKREREKIAPEILRLSDELLK